MAATDILTLEEAKPLCNIRDSDTVHDGDIAGLVTAVSLRIDELCGPVVTRSITAETYNGGTASIRLRHAPVYSVTSVTQYAGTAAQVLTAQSNTAHASTNYLYDDTTQRLYRTSSGVEGLFPAGRRNIAVTYVAGRYATTAGVSERFKRAAGIILGHLWKSDRGGGTDTFGAYPVGFAIPNRALELLGDEVRGPMVA